MTEMTQASPSGNPFFEDWATPDGVAPFDRIAPKHFREAYGQALAEHEVEIAAIADDPSPPSFANTIAALELSGRALDRVENVFHVLARAGAGNVAAPCPPFQQDQYQRGAVPSHRRADA
jgi:Zn-dependent oligopeptidase